MTQDDKAPEGTDIPCWMRGEPCTCPPVARAGRVVSPEEADAVLLQVLADRVVINYP